MDTIKYESPNGYTGILCTKDGKSELVIFDRRLKQVLHTASPKGNTMEWLIETVEGMPELLEEEHVAEADE